MLVVKIFHCSLCAQIGFCNQSLVLVSLLHISFILLFKCRTINKFSSNYLGMFYIPKKKMFEIGPDVCCVENRKFVVKTDIVGVFSPPEVHIYFS